MADVAHDWTAERLKEAIYAKRVSMEHLALSNGVSAATVRIALIRRLPAGERIISEFLGVPVQEIWPSRYFEDGRSRSRPIRRPEATAPDRTAHGQKAASA